jgi:CHAT domain-containing protein
MFTSLKCLRGGSVVYFVVTLPLLIRCSAPEAQLASPDFIDASAKSTVHARAARLRDAGAFSAASELYDSLSRTAYLNDHELRFLVLSKYLCLVMAGDESFVAPPSKAQDQLRLLETLVVNSDSLRNGNPDVQVLIRIRKSLIAQGFQRSVYHLLTLENLSYSHRRMGAYIDSAKYYIEEAIALSKNNERLRANLPRLQLHLATIHMMNRDALTALGVVEQALSLPAENYVHAKLWLLKATALRKLGRLDESSNVHASAEQIISHLSSGLLSLHLLREKALHALYSNDDRSFLLRVGEMEKLAGLVRGESFQPDQLYGYYFMLKGENRKSIFHYERSLSVLEKQPFPDPTLYMEGLNVLAELYLADKKFELAETTAYRALVGLSRHRNTSYEWANVLQPEIASEKYNFIDYEVMARIFLARYRESKDPSSLKKSLTLYAFIDSTMLHQIRVVEEEAVLRFTEIGHNVYSGAIEACYYAYREWGKNNFIEQAHQYMERSKALVMYRDILTHDLSYFPEVSSAFRSRELELKSRLASIKRSGKHEDLPQTLSEFSAYYKEMENLYPRYFAAKYQLSIAPYSHYQQLALQQNKSIIQYHVGSNHLYILKYDQPVKFEQIPAGPALEKAVVELRQVISTPPSLNDSLSAKNFGHLSTFLFDVLIRPVGDLKHQVLFVPDGILSQIPFECLMDSKANTFSTMKFLVREHSISYGHSLKTISTGGTRGPFENIFGVAFSSEKDSYSGELEPLPGSAKELKQIERDFEQTTAFYGKDATKDRFVDEIVGDYNVLHIAMHASSNPHDHLDNKIYFRNRRGTIDTLYGYEISPLKIHAHTVVLTACESAFGATVQGEGTFSLTRSFREAGADYVVSSLWNLADHASVKLTDGFYENARAGLAPPQALAISKQNYLDQANELTAAPFYWASLVCFGF